MRPFILSLCDYSGAWPSFYNEEGYTVLIVDPKHPATESTRFDLRADGIYTFAGTVQDICADKRRFFSDFASFLGEPSCPRPRGIMAAPVCTDFTVSGAQYWPEKDADGRTAKSLELVDACLEVIEYAKPKWWVLENPVGRLPKLRPNLGKPRIYFHPWEFAGHAPDPEKDRYTKKTGLWGDFNTDLPKKPLDPYRFCEQGSWLQLLGGKSERTKELRSMTPLGFSRAFQLANP